MSNYNENEIDAILNGPIFKFAELIEQMPEEVILMGSPAIFKWFNENMKDLL